MHGLCSICDSSNFKYGVDLMNPRVQKGCKMNLLPTNYFKKHVLINIYRLDFPCLKHSKVIYLLFMYLFVLVWPVPLARVLCRWPECYCVLNWFFLPKPLFLEFIWNFLCPQLIFPSKTSFFGIYLVFSAPEILYINSLTMF
jgi:hypothetical protein